MVVKKEIEGEAKTKSSFTSSGKKSENKGRCTEGKRSQDNPEQQ